MKSTDQKILKFIEENELIKEGDKILVALSGGPDSVFLLHFLSKYKSKLKIKIAALHVNHKLRDKDSDNDELFCTNYCRKKRIQLTVIKKNCLLFATQNKISIEEAGRIIRYDELKKFADKNEYSLIATAHIASDNSETILLNLIKGTGLKGIAGIPIKRENIIRPLLCLTKDEILTSLFNLQIPYCVDSTNQSSDYERNFIRNEIIPLLKNKLNPNLDNSLLRSSFIIRETLKSVAYFLQTVIDDVVTIRKNQAEIVLTELQKYDYQLLGEVLKYLFQKYFKKEMTYEDYLSVKKLITKQTGRKLILSDNLNVIKERNKIIISYAEDVSISEKVVKLGKSISIDNKILSIKIKKSGKFSSSKEKEYICADDLDDNFIIRTWKPGDKFYPLGMKNQKKLSDFLTEQKIPSSIKKEQLVLVNRSRIVWVIGLRIDERFKLTQSTIKVCQLWLKTK